MCGVCNSICTIGNVHSISLAQFLRVFSFYDGGGGVNRLPSIINFAHISLIRTEHISIMVMSLKLLTRDSEAREKSVRNIPYKKMDLWLFLQTLGLNHRLLLSTVSHQHIKFYCNSILLPSVIFQIKHVYVYFPLCV